MRVATAKRTRFLKPPFCKPCWELHYCPYGVLVESMPFCDSPEDKKRQKEWGWNETQEQMYVRAKRDLTTTKPDDDNEVWRNMFFVMFADGTPQSTFSFRCSGGGVQRCSSATIGGWIKR